MSIITVELNDNETEKFYEYGTDLDLRFHQYLKDNTDKIPDSDPLATKYQKFIKLQFNVDIEARRYSRPNVCLTGPAHQITLILLLL